MIPTEVTVGKLPIGAVILHAGVPRQVKGISPAGNHGEVRIDYIQEAENRATPYLYCKKGDLVLMIEAPT